LGYSLEELLPLYLSRVFTDQSDNSEALLRKLRIPNPHIPFQLCQLCKDGTLLNVEIRVTVWTSARARFCFSLLMMSA